MTSLCVTSVITLHYRQKYPTRTAFCYSFSVAKRP